MPVILMRVELLEGELLSLGSAHKEGTPHAQLDSSLGMLTITPTRNDSMI